MSRGWLHGPLSAAVVFCVLGGANTTFAIGPEWETAPYVYGAARNGLFYNYYAPSNVGGPPAQLYVSPRPTPPFVGHTYITYEPLEPHEFLYRHKKVYRRYDGGVRPANTTRVWWWHMPQIFHHDIHTRW